MSEIENPIKHSYEISPRPVELGGGWRLRLLENGEEVGGGVFPVPAVDAEAVMTWWSAWPEQGRAHWQEIANSNIPADVHYAYMQAEAHSDAETVAYEWLDSRGCT